MMPNSTKVFVGGIPKNVEEKSLREEVIKYGKVVHVYYVPATEQTSRGWAFITFENISEARRAIEALHGKFIFPNSERTLEVKFADSKQNRTNGVKGDKQVFNNNPKGKKYGMKPMMGNTQRQCHNGVKEQINQGVSRDAMSLQQFKGKSANSSYRQPGANIFVFHLPSQWTDQDLRKHFKPFGYILSAHVQKDESGKNKGYGFVSYNHPASALNAIKRMNGFHVSGKYLKVQLKRGEEQYFQMNYMVQNNMMPSHGMMMNQRPLLTNDQTMMVNPQSMMVNPQSMMVNRQPMMQQQIPNFIPPFNYGPMDTMNQMKSKNYVMGKDK